MGDRYLALAQEWKVKRLLTGVQGYDTVRTTLAVGGTGLSLGPGDVIRA